jgi:glycine/D-amino acid oxidase-like deaminating enzyme
VLCLLDFCSLRLKIQKNSAFRIKNVFEICEKNTIKKFGFQNVETLLHTPYEAQLNTGKMIKTLYKYANKKGITIKTGVQVIDLQEDENYVYLKTKQEITFKAHKIAICNNAFAQEIYPNLAMKAGRGQVLITEPLPKKLCFKGSFHLESGFYYFRNIGENRVLLGGARHKAIEEETATEIKITNFIQNDLENLLKTVILPNVSFQIAERWAGIMAFTPNHQPIIEKKSPKICIGIALNGMGVAIASKVAQDLLKIIE